MKNKLYYKIKKFFLSLTLLFAFVVFANIMTMLYVSKINNKNLKSEVLNYYIEKNVSYDDTSEYLQKTYYTCGPAALNYLLYLYGVNTTEEKLATLSKTNEKGTTLLNLKYAAERCGFKARGLKANFEYLKEIRKPVITYVKGNHYVVVEDITNKYVSLFDPDPEYGEIRIPIKIFKEAWNNIVLKINTKPLVMR
ncbi:hypothetical protein OSSY52_00450 [Tepiditoga spiralis]|uniref:Peptidase C39 domain-containing protein n=1 Tax=Tepiditoga spiralis TaxID=2108365 RepID=A0A7G1G4G2_9BACT|nr:cysteine peptidase family C39 domain-containing protein [Tepiditoga spiralis]BBE29904.1 hypothetical protein OSSY52_00450 [Tepiditoga spiralis]